MVADLAIADDDMVLSACLADYLRAHGLHVATVGDGAALMQALRSRAADLVLLDLNMPGEDGLSVARALRCGEFGDPAIITLTGAADVVDRVAGLEVGADDYVAKPCDPRELLARIRAVLRRRHVALPRAAKPALVRMGDKNLDLEARCLIGPGQER